MVCFVFQARLFDEPQLASLCLENIDKNTGDALAAEGFTDIDLGNMALKILAACCVQEFLVSVRTVIHLSLR